VLESADLAICHMEIPIGVPNGPFGDVGRSPYGGNLLLAPYEIAAGLGGAGFDRCSTASNHAYDTGTAGIASTIEALTAQQISVAGTARTPEEAADTLFDVNGVAVAHLAFTTYSNTARPASSWRLDYVDSPWTVVSRVEAARQSGAEVVLVSLHVSKELTSGPVAADRAFVRTLTAAADVDAVFLHGPHVVHPFEWVNDTPVWWSVGNFFTQMGPGSSGKYNTGWVTDGLLAAVDFLETSSGAFSARPSSIATCNDFVDRTVRSATASLAASPSTRVHDELSACLARTRTVVPDAR
ncbi:MAG: CapA family protein, partial [Ilumatobacteraceae bacterium]